MKEIFLFVISHPPVATIVTGLIAIITVILSQIWIDSRQRKDHKHQRSLKHQELLLAKKEEVIDLCNIQVELISQIELVFEQWFENYDEHYDSTKIRILQSKIDGNVSKLNLIINLYLPEMESYIVRIDDETQGFIELCADYSMGGKFGKENYLKLDYIEVVEVSNEYAGSFMYLSSNLANMARQKI
ncbi:hypothetical protein [Psychromonas sp. L1A2]|uniref:hypothetical protein n=1 Tax=Psychromonas sp. L1A2 TaxID=2686356 RepID=UPI00135883F2|nr:hypothetical protein [Psychromonas sp. L1A2]